MCLPYSEKCPSRHNTICPSQQNAYKCSSEHNNMCPSKPYAMCPSKHLKHIQAPVPSRVGTSYPRTQRMKILGAAGAHICKCFEI